MTKSKPGVLLYFDLRPALKRLSYEEKGVLLDAIIDYGEHGAEPVFDGALGVVWDFVQLRLDADDRAYQLKCQHAKEAAEARWRRGENVVACSGIRTHAKNANYNSTSISTTSSNTKEVQMARTDAVEAYDSKKKYGAYGWISLTEMQYAKMFEDLGEKELTRCIAYVDELAQTNGNKYRWTDWETVLRKCSREKWGITAGSGRLRPAGERDYSRGESFLDG